MGQSFNISNRVPRIEDLPYYTSPPMQFVFTQKAILTAGRYPFTAPRAVMTGTKNINDSTMVYIKAFTFSADIPILDFQAALQLSDPNITGTTDSPGQYKLIDSTATFLTDGIVEDDVVYNNTTGEQTTVVKVVSNTQLDVADNIFGTNAQSYTIFVSKTDIPTFQMFLESDRNAPLFRDPLQLDNYFSDQEFKQLKEPKADPNKLTGFFRGTLQQHAGLAGITEINLTINVWCQEVTDDTFIDSVKKGYPVSIPSVEEELQ